jgi:hypothetical protein
MIKSSSTFYFFRPAVWIIQDGKGSDAIAYFPEWKPALTYHLIMSDLGTCVIDRPYAVDRTEMH